LKTVQLWKSLRRHYKFNAARVFGFPNKSLVRGDVVDAAALMKPAKPGGPSYAARWRA